RIGVEDFVGELRRDRRIHCEATNGSAANAIQHAPQALDIHGLGQHVLHDLVDEGMVRNLDVSYDVLLAGSHVGKDGCKEIIAADALNLRWNFLPALEAQQRQRTVGIPAPARRKDWRCERGLLQYPLHRLALQVVEDVTERKAV